MQNKFWSSIREVTNAQIGWFLAAVVFGLFMAFVLGVMFTLTSFNISI